MQGFYSSSVPFSSADETWKTPADLYESLNGEFGFGLDAAALQSSTLVPGNWYGPDHPDPARRDCLLTDWVLDCDGKPVFMNPPYGRGIGKFMEKAFHEHRRGCTVVCLVPARTDTNWWHNNVIAANATVRFIRGRLRFNDGPNAAPFPSAIVLYL